MHLPRINFLRAPVLPRSWTGAEKKIENNPFCPVPTFHVPRSCRGLGPGYRHPPDRFEVTVVSLGSPHGNQERSSEGNIENAIGRYKEV